MKMEITRFTSVDARTTGIIVTVDDKIVSSYFDGDGFDETYCESVIEFYREEVPDLVVSDELIVYEEWELDKLFRL